MSILPPEKPGPALSTRKIAFTTLASAPKRSANAPISASGTRVASCARRASSEKPAGGPAGGGSGGGTGGGAGGVAGGGTGGVAGGGAGGVAGGGAGGVRGGDGGGDRGGGGGGGDVGRELPRVPKMARK